MRFPSQSHAHPEGSNGTSFNSLPQSGGVTQPQVDPNALAQAMSFMATPAGAQTMAAFATHMASTSTLPIAPNTQTNATQSAQSPPRFSPIQQAGQKRKWEDRSKQARAPSKPPRAKAAVAPAVPSFGFSLPTTQPAPAMQSQNTNSKNIARGKVRLGLTDQVLPSESSGDEEEDEVDEEAAFSEKIKGGGYSFEHEGQQISLQTAADIAAWIKDRRKNFPTAQKVAEKAEATAAKRKHELEFIRKLKGKQPQAEVSETPKFKQRTQERLKKDEKKQEELAALRKKLHESMKAKKATPAVDLGLGYGSETESEAESSVLSESSVVSSSEEDEESDESSDESDAAPETSSSKIGPPPINVPPPAPTTGHTRSKPDKERICQKFKQFGKCPFGNSCKFKHSYKEEQRLSLYEKLVEQELVKSDQLALDAIKYLGQNGFLG